MMYRVGWDRIGIGEESASKQALLERDADYYFLLYVQQYEYLISSVTSLGA